MLEISGLIASYGDATVLRGVDLSVEQGQVVSVIGPNGAGKSTLLHAIMGMVQVKGADGGAIRFEGQVLDGLAVEKIVRLGLALVPEGAPLFADMSCHENLLVGGYLVREAGAFKANLKRVHSLFPVLAERASQKASTLSGGERKMLAMGRALMSGPRLLLLDEPSLGLHPLMAERLFGAVSAIARQGVTVLLVEQKVAFALEISQHAYVLENGQVALSGPAREVHGHPHVKRAYLAL